MEVESYHRNSQCRAKCCAIGCNSKMNVNKNLSFHKLPRSGLKMTLINSHGKSVVVDKQSEWLRSLGLSGCTKSAVVCSRHFDPADFYLSSESRMRRRFLKPNAIPKYAYVTEDEEEELMVLRKRQSTNVNSEAVTEDHNYSEARMEVLNILHDNDTTIVYGLENHNNDCDAKLNDELCDNENSGLCSEFIVGGDSSIYQNECENVKSENLVSTFSSFIQTKADLKTMCNIMSFEILDKLAELLDEIYPFQGKQVLSTRDCIILTTAKLKLDISFDALTVFYKPISEGYIRNTFYVTLKKLATIMQSLIKRVPKQNIECNTFELVRESILNCTEIEIQKPKCLKCLTKFYSHYNDQLKVKFITEVTPAGSITLINKSFVSGSNNNKSFDLYEISQHLEFKRDVNVNQELFVDDEYVEKKVQLMKFPIIKEEDLLSEEITTNENITRTRVYIERINQQLRQLKMLDNKIPWHMVHYAEDMFIICCGLTFLDSLLFTGDTF